MQIVRLGETGSMYEQVGSIFASSSMTRGLRDDRHIKQVKLLARDIPCHRLRSHRESTTNLNAHRLLKRDAHAYRCVSKPSVRSLPLSPSRLPSTSRLLPSLLPLLTSLLLDLLEHLLDRLSRNIWTPWILLRIV